MTDISAAIWRMRGAALPIRVRAKSHDSANRLGSFGPKVEPTIRFQRSTGQSNARMRPNQTPAVPLSAVIHQFRWADPRDSVRISPSYEAIQVIPFVRTGVRPIVHPRTRATSCRGLAPTIA